MSVIVDSFPAIRTSSLGLVHFTLLEHVNNCSADTNRKENVKKRASGFMGNHERHNDRANISLIKKNIFLRSFSKNV